MFAGAVKGSGIGCGNQFRSLCLFPAILVFFPFVTSQPARSFCQDTFLFDKLLGHNRTPALLNTCALSGETRHSTGSPSDGIQPPCWDSARTGATATRCCSTKGGVTAALKCFLGGLMDFWLKESEKLFAPVNTRAWRI